MAATWSSGKRSSYSGAIEPAFWATLLRRMGLDDVEPARQRDRSTWTATRSRLAQRFRERTRDEWCETLEDCDACFAPVLALGEAEHHRHLADRGALVRSHGLLQPAPAPRLSATPGRLGPPPPRPGEHTTEALRDWGIPDDELARLQARRLIGWRGPPWPGA